VNKEQFKSYFSQFRGDIPFQTELFNLLVTQMPKNYVDSIIKEMYFDRVYEGTYFIVQHSIFKDVKEYFTDQRSVVEFLNKSMFNGDTVSEYQVKQSIERGIIIHGYKVYKIKKA
jgi:hypothetical protein